MRQTIHKCFFVWDFDKEEQWLNEMAAKGLALVSVGFCKYEFEDCVPGEYRVCLQLLDKLPRHPEMQKYIEFMEETGAEHVGSFTRWIYFRKKAAEGSFEVFSDNASRVKYLTNITSFVSLIIGLFGGNAVGFREITHINGESKITGRFTGIALSGNDGRRAGIHIGVGGNHGKFQLFL